MKGNAQQVSHKLLHCKEDQISDNCFYLRTPLKSTALTTHHSHPLKVQFSFNLSSNKLK